MCDNDTAGTCIIIIIIIIRGRASSGTQYTVFVCRFLDTEQDLKRTLGCIYGIP